MSNSKILRLLAFILIKQCLGLELNSWKNAPYDQLCKVNDNYDKNIVPGSLPLTLLLTIDILEVAEVNIIEGSIAVIIFLTVHWKDQNLAYTPNQTLVYYT